MSPPFHLEYFDPPRALDRYVLTFFHFAWDASVVSDRQPGGLGQLVLFPLGSGMYEHLGQRVGNSAYLMSGFSVARPFRMEGPWRALGASLSPLGWASLTGASASAHLDRFFPAEELLGDDIATFTDDLCRRYRTGELSGRAACDALGRWMVPRLRPLQPSHDRLIGRTIAWLGSSLNPDVETLLARLHYSRRQAERLVQRYFGVPPHALARKFRAIRAAALLGQPDLADEDEAAIAEAFYDQSHMVREIRRYSGYTPTRLGGASDPLFHTMLRLKNLDRLQALSAAE